MTRKWGRSPFFADLVAALEQFREIATDLGGGETKTGQNTPTLMAETEMSGKIGYLQGTCPVLRGRIENIALSAIVCFTGT